MVLPVLRIHERSFQERILHEDIPPGLTNSRKDFCCNPMLKGFGRFKFAAQDERVEAGFVDNGHSSVRNFKGNVL